MIEENPAGFKARARFASRARNCDVSFTPGFSPVSNDDKRPVIVLTVFSSAPNSEPFKFAGLAQPPDNETVETVS